MPYPTQYRYTREHEWIHVDGTQAVVGITDHAQHELGDIVFVELPSVGSRLEAGTALGTVESVKAVSEVFAPVSGTVVEVNEALHSTPELVNQEPHARGWLVRITLNDANAANSLMDAAAYQQFVGA